MEIQVVTCGFAPRDPDQPVSRAPGRAHTLELVVAGQGAVRLGGVESPLRPGSLFHHDAATRMELRSDPARPVARYFLGLIGARAPARLRAAGIRPGAVVQLVRFLEIQRVLEDLIREGRKERATAGRICVALVEVLLLKIEELARRRAPKNDPGEETFLRCKGAVDAQAARLATLGDITEAVGLEASQLCRLFRRYQGQSPYQYLLRRKMAVAAELLMDPNVLVKEAASHVGFADPYHFSRCFKRIHRVAPKGFQRSLKDPALLRAGEIR